MTSRERVLMAVNRQKPDRTPRLLYGQLIGYVPAIRRLLEQKCSPKTAGEYFEMDLGRVQIAQTKLGDERFDDWLPANAGADAAELPVNEWGIRKRVGGVYHFSHIESPLLGIEDLDRIKEFPWPDMDAEYRYAGLTQQVRTLHRKELAVLGSPGSVFERAWAIRGMEMMMEDMLIRPEIAHHLLQRVAHYQKFAAVQLARAGVDILALGDDIAMQTGMMMSLETWREFLKPLLQATIRAAKTENPQIKVFYHSDGNVEAAVPELIEIGVDILNPVQPECMDPGQIKKKYGKDLAFFGTISVQQTLPFGSPEDVKQEVRTRIRTVGYDGGLILCPSHVLEPEVPWENIVAFFEAADEKIP